MADGGGCFSRFREPDHNFTAAFLTPRLRITLSPETITTRAPGTPKCVRSMSVSAATAAIRALSM